MKHVARSMLLYPLCVCAVLGCRVQREPVADPLALAQARDGGVDAFGSPVSGRSRGDAGDAEDVDDAADGDDGDGAMADGAAGAASPPAADDDDGDNDGERGSERDAGAGPSAGGPVAGSGGMDTDGTTPAAPSDGGAACVEPTVATCNPLTNTGCAPELMMQCAVDVLAPVLAGYCTFSAPPTGTACLNTGITESCPPTTTCVAGECRPLCFCDSDCEQGQCCTDPIGTQGFKVCGEC